MRRWYIKGGIIAFGTVVVVHYTMLQFVVEHRTEKNLQIVEDFPYLLSTPGCQIPNMEVLSYDAFKASFDSGPLRCGKPPMVVSNDTHLTFLRSNMRFYQQSFLKYINQTVSCCYRPFWRHSPNVSNDVSKWIEDKVKYDFDIRYADKCKPFNNSVQIEDEFVQVKCEYHDHRNNLKVYTDYHAFFPKPKSPRPKTKKNNINVLIVGLDSLSRLNAIRKMPQTYNFLVDTLKGIPMHGFNKVGANTQPNLLALFTGLNKTGMKATCLPSDDAHYDKCHFIFKDFAKKGYQTTYVMDRAKEGGLFDYWSYGFVHQPTDYFGETFFIPLKDQAHNGAWKCVGPRSQIGVLLNYTHKNAKSMTRYNENFFTFSWGVSLTHNGFNDPQQADPLYYDFLNAIHHDGILNNTFLIFMSDHGLRFGDYLRSFQGQLEDRLPALIFAVPDSFRQKYHTAMKNLQTNQNRLLTNLDLHATLLDLSDLSALGEEEIRTRQRKLKGDASKKSGISLFLSIPEERTCADANIPEEFCSCEVFEAIDSNAGEVIKAAQLMVNHINLNLLRNDSRCETRRFSRVDKAATTPRLHVGEDSWVVKYQVSFFSDPGDALFSGLVRHFQNGSMEVVGELSRMNIYGAQSKCMTDGSLLPFCYCKQ